MNQITLALNPVLVQAGPFPLRWYSLAITLGIATGIWLAAAGVGIWVVAPNLIGAALPLLLVAACPLSMLLMMRGMGGGQGTDRPRQAASAPQADQQSAPPGLVAGSLAEMKSQAVGLQRQHEEIARAIARLEASDSSAVREAEAVVRAAHQRVQG